MLRRAHAVAQKGPGLWDRINPFSDYNIEQKFLELVQYCAPNCNFNEISPEMAQLYAQYTGAAIGGAGTGPLKAMSLTTSSTTNLGKLMRSSGYSPTQSMAKMDIAKVNRYAAMMRSGQWDWSASKIIVDSNNAIMSGHHRVVASQLSGVKIPESAIYRMSGATERTVHSW